MNEKHIFDGHEYIRADVVERDFVRKNSSEAAKLPRGKWLVSNRDLTKGHQSFVVKVLHTKAGRGVTVARFDSIEQTASFVAQFHEYVSELIKENGGREACPSGGKG